jgi:hypothetical protein
MTPWRPKEKRYLATLLWNGRIAANDVGTENLDVVAVLACIQDRGLGRPHHLGPAVADGLGHICVGIEADDVLLDADVQAEVGSVVANAVDERGLRR